MKTFAISGKPKKEGKYCIGIQDRMYEEHRLTEGKKG